jgi:hypothetical protein
MVFLAECFLTDSMNFGVMYTAQAQLAVCAVVVGFAVAPSSDYVPVMYFAFDAANNTASVFQ